MDLSHDLRYQVNNFDEAFSTALDAVGVQVQSQTSQLLVSDVGQLNNLLVFKYLYFPSGCHDQVKPKPENSVWSSVASKFPD